MSRMRFDFDIQGMNPVTLRTIFDVAGLINDICSAVGCQPRCLIGNGVFGKYTEAGEAVDEIGQAAGALRTSIRAEVLGQPISDDVVERQAQLDILLWEPNDVDDVLAIAARFKAAGAE